MSAILTRSSILAAKEETTEGTLEAIASGSDFIQLREGFTLQNENEVIDTDSLTNDIGKSKSIVVGENPSASIPLYNKHSDVEGQEPEFGILIESCMGDKTVISTERDTVAGSTVSVLNVDTGEGASSFEEGQAVLVKDGTNGYSIRNVNSISTDALTLGFNLSNAPASGVNLGKPILYKPAATGHPTFSLYRFQSETSSAFKDAIAGCRTTALAMEFPARDLATISPEIEGLNFYWDYLVVDATNDDFDITDDGGNVTGSITQKAYKTPIALADEIATKLSAASVDVITCVYSSSTGKFTIESDGATFELNCSTANSVFAAIGFGAIDLTGATGYTAATAFSYDAPYTPSFDASDPIKVVDSELLLGDVDEITCRSASNVSINIGTPKTDVLSICAENGKSETLILEREVILTATLILQPYEAEIFDRSINNTTTPLMFNTGVKDNTGNWTAGKCINVFFQAASLTGTTVADQDGYSVINLEAKGFVTSGEKDVYINYI